MPPFDRVLLSHAKSAVAIVRAGEIAHSSGTPVVRKEWSVVKLEALYELAFLRVFAAWEICLESLFYRSLCGYASSAGQETLVGGRAYFTSLASAELVVLGSKRTYMLWHDPQQVINRCKGYIASGPCLQEITIASNLSRLVQLSATRHRIVHNQTDAKKKFDSATLAITGRTYAASRPGKFLRDWDPSTSPPRRWLEVVVAELSALTRQMV
jgi:hypothetical protein